MGFGKKSSSKPKEETKVAPAEPAPVENIGPRLAARDRAEENPSPQLLSANTPDDDAMRRRRRASLLGSTASGMSTY